MSMNRCVVGIGIVLIWMLSADCMAQDDSPARPEARRVQRESAADVRVRVVVRYRDQGTEPEHVVLRLSDPFGEWPRPANVDRLRPFPPDPELEGRDGVIDACIPIAGEFNVLAVIADGHEYRFPNLRLDLQDGADRTILLDRVRPMTLRVVDAISGEPLPGARLYYERHGRYGAPFGPHAMFPSERTLGGRPQTADRDGRIRVDPGADILRSYAIADAHAWRPLRILPTIGGEATVSLVPGGGIRLHVRGWSGLEMPMMSASCRGPAFASLLPRPNTHGEIALVGVPVGVVRFDVLHSSRPEICYGSCDVEVVAGETRALDIDTSTAAANRMVESAKGTLTVPAAWRWPAGPVSMHLQGSEPALTSTYVEFFCDIGSADKPHTFHTEPIPVGSYELEIGVFGWHSKVRVEAGQSLNLVVPEPRTAVLWFDDAASGAAVPVASLTCRVPDAWTLPPLLVSQDRMGRHVVRTASDRLSVAAIAQGYAGLAKMVDLRANETTHVRVRLLRGGDLRVRLTLEGRAFGGDGINTVMSLGTAPQPTLWRQRWTPHVQKAAFCQGVVQYEGLEPGTWTLALEEIVGIEPVLREVQVRPDQTTEIDLDLRRSR